MPKHKLSSSTNHWLEKLIQNYYKVEMPWVPTHNAFFYCNNARLVNNNLIWIISLHSPDSLSPPLVVSNKISHCCDSSTLPIIVIYRHQTKAHCCRAYFESRRTSSGKIHEIPFFMPLSSEEFRCVRLKSWKFELWKQFAAGWRLIQLNIYRWSSRNVCAEIWYLCAPGMGRVVNNFSTTVFFLHIKID